MACSFFNHEVLDFMEDMFEKGGKLHKKKHTRCLRSTLPETNIAPEKAFPKGKQYSNHHFSGAMLVSGGVKIFKLI